MISIHSVHPGPEHAAGQSSARLLFGAYADFLRSLEDHAAFDFARFEDEIATLPSAYTDRNGEVLLAQSDSIAAGCIAYRESSEGAAVRSCELKRLFVLPNFRGRNLGKKLVLSALARATSRGFTRAVLDTDRTSMPTAYRAYVQAGFQEYSPRTLQESGPLVFLERTLP